MDEQPTIRDQHEQAMALCDESDEARRNDLDEQARELYSRACDLEAAAAQRVGVEVEPTRSVLHRSAAWLAVFAGRFERAETLALAGLSGNAPAPIADELREALAAARSRQRPSRAQA